MTQKEIAFIIYKELGWYSHSIKWIEQYNNTMVKLGFDVYASPSWGIAEKHIKNFDINERNNTKLYNKLVLTYKKWKTERRINKIQTDF